MNGQRTEEEFRRKYPDVRIDPEFFKLVGILPSTSVEHDKKVNYIVTRNIKHYEQDEIPVLTPDELLERI